MRLKTLEDIYITRLLACQVPHIGQCSAAHEDEGKSRCWSATRLSPLVLGSVKNHILLSVIQLLTQEPKIIWHE